MAVINPSNDILKLLQEKKASDLQQLSSSNIMQGIIELYRKSLLDNLNSDTFVVIERGFETCAELVENKVRIEVAKGSCVYGNSEYELKDDFIFEFDAPAAMTDYYGYIFYDEVDGEGFVGVAVSATELADSKYNQISQVTYVPGNRTFKIDNSKLEILKNSFDGLTKKIELANKRMDTIPADNLLAELKTVDGDGSGLDADTVDGVQAADLAKADLSNISALGKILDLDGDGSGLDADTVDGVQAADFSQKAADETIDGSKTWTNGTLVMSNLPTSDPGVAGQLYVDSSNNLKVSAGS